MTSCTNDMPRSACSVALETYHGASTIILRILDWLLCIIDMLDLLAQPYNSRPYVQIGMITAASSISFPIQSPAILTFNAMWSHTIAALSNKQHKIPS
jgi:hypothetical protein